MGVEAYHLSTREIRVSLRDFFGLIKRLIHILEVQNGILDEKKYKEMYYGVPMD